MKLFKWKGLSVNGDYVSGEETANNRKTLEIDLALRDIVLLKAKPVRSKRILKSGDVDFLLMQLATLLGANLPLAEVFNLLHRQAPRELQGILTQVWNRIESGESLAQSLEPYLEPNNQFIAHIIQVGENSGQIVPLLDALSDYRERQQQITAKTKKALIYPVTVLCTALGVGVLLLTSVVPQFAAMYQGTENLPAYTRITIQASNFVIRHGMLMFSSVALATGVLIMLYKHIRYVRYTVSWLMLELPVIGKLNKARLQYLFAMLVKVSYRAGTPIDQTLTWLPQTTSNLVFIEKIIRLKGYLMQGNSLYESIKRVAVFGSFFEQMISVGENSGKFENALQQITKYYNARIEDYAGKLIRMIEPALIIVTAGIIGWIVASMYLPIFNLGTVL